MNKDIYRKYSCGYGYLYYFVVGHVDHELFSSEGRYAASDRGGGDLEATERYESG